MRALLLIDLQYDFCPGGALAVAHGDETIAVANRVIPKFADGVVVATQDWHPANHGSFGVTQGKQPYELGELGGLPQVMWPAHCVQGSRGAELHAELAQDQLAHVSRKGTDAGIDSYSGFFDNGHKQATDLDTWLRSRGVTEVTILGLATDYCVKFTALDAIQLGYAVTLIEDGCRAVDLAPGDGARALDELRAAGVRIRRSTDL